VDRVHMNQFIAGTRLLADQFWNVF